MKDAHQAATDYYIYFDRSVVDIKKNCENDYDNAQRPKEVSSKAAGLKTSLKLKDWCYYIAKKGNKS